MKHKIVKKDYIYECGDGCCTEFGFDWYVNGEFVHSSSCEDSGWIAVLAQLGIQVELVNQDEKGEDVCSLDNFIDDDE